MKRVKLSLIKSGMVLAEDIVDDQEKLILAQDTKLTPESIRYLKDQHVTYVSIKSDDAQLLDKLEAQLVSETEMQLYAKFLGDPRDIPLVSQIIHLVVTRKLKDKFQNRLTVEDIESAMDQVSTYIETQW